MQRSVAGKPFIPSAIRSLACRNDEQQAVPEAMIDKLWWAVMGQKLSLPKLRCYSVTREVSDPGLLVANYPEEPIQTHALLAGPKMLMAEVPRSPWQYHQNNLSAFTRGCVVLFHDVVHADLPACSVNMVRNLFTTFMAVHAA